jgi:hypothetical protein
MHPSLEPFIRPKYIPAELQKTGFVYGRDTYVILESDGNQPRNTPLIFFPLLIRSGSLNSSATMSRVLSL